MRQRKQTKRNTFRCQSYAIELKDKLHKENDMTIKEILKKYVFL